jgi:hypothetical protein
MMIDEREEQRARLLRRLALIVDETRPTFIRLAAIRAVQRSLAIENPLRLETAMELLDRVMPPWATRPYRNGYGRFEERLVQRPPTGLRDVWS